MLHMKLPGFMCSLYVLLLNPRATHSPYKGHNGSNKLSNEELSLQVRQVFIGSFPGLIVKTVYKL